MLNKSFLRKVSRFVSSHDLLNRSDKYLIALSGGADSVAMALALKELGYHVEAAHCNFRLRGEESYRDERFCVRFCQDNGIKLHLTHFDTMGFAQLRHLSIEMAARHLRYSYFDRLLNDIGAAAVCVAHHQDDSVETVLLNLIRGTGIHGLTGIKCKNGKVVRPMLCVKREEIECALREAGQEFVTDSTNLVDDVVRNKIRLDILPLMREINPSVSDSIAKTAERVGEAAKVFDAVLDASASKVVVKTDDGRMKILSERLKAEPSPEYLLFLLLKDFSFNPSQVEQVYRSLDADAGRTFYSPTHQLLIDRDCIVVEPLVDDAPRKLVIPEGGVFVYDDSMKFRVEKIVLGQDGHLTKARNCCCADLSKVKFPLTIRPVRTGDRFVPFGMRGSKLVSDYLTDAKMNLFDKRRQLVLTDASGRIVWLVNQRTDNRCRISGDTEKMLMVTCVMD